MRKNRRKVSGVGVQQCPSRNRDSPRVISLTKEQRSNPNQKAEYQSNTVPKRSTPHPLRCIPKPRLIPRTRRPQQPPYRPIMPIRRLQHTRRDRHRIPQPCERSSRKRLSCLADSKLGVARVEEDEREAGCFDRDGA